MHEADAHDLFLRALDLPNEHRAGFLAEECPSPELREEVEALLQALDEAEGFLDGTVSGATQEQVGTLIAGRYRLLEEIGEGGFGVVWMAEQIEPVRRRVALKVLKAGMDTRSVVARFMAERQALALMNHPHIARVHDAGTTDSGRPFFVMELVQGLPITKFCDDAGLDIPGRLRLFQQVCHAVEHAHQKGIVHRDLKPGNLLVGLIDGRPVPRVIDFGVAKAIRADELTQLTLFTGFRQAVGTPEYMAPEQTGISMVDVDTRADVYALGVVLYELLTGRKPFSLKDSVSDGGGYEDFLRRIREVDPPKPSTRVANASTGVELRALAEQRGTGVARWSRMLRGDLDWIVVKALQKERDRRYPTASSLAADVERYLEGRPVEAGPPSYRYRLGRFVSQHRVALAVVGVVFAALLGAVISTTLALERALAAESDSRLDAQRTRSALAAMRRFIGDVNPHSPLGPDRTLRDLLDQRSGALIAATAGQPAVEASVRSTIGSAYRAMGVLDRAREHLERAVALHGTEERDDVRGRADALWHMASLLHDEGRFDEALRTIEESLELARGFDAGDGVEIGQRQYIRADLLRHLGRHDEALAAVEPAIEVFSRQSNEHLSLALSLNVPGMVAMDRRQPEVAEPLFRRSLARARHAEPEGGLVTCSCLVNLGTALIVRGRSEEAEPCFREALDAYRRLLPGSPIRYLAALEGLGIALERQSRFEDAKPLHEEAVAVRSRYGLRGTLSYVRVVARLAHQLVREGEHDAAAGRYEDAIGVLRNLFGGQDNAESAALATCAARALLRAARPGEALPYARAALAWHESQTRPDDLAAQDTRSILGASLAAVGQDAEGERLMTESARDLAVAAESLKRRIEAVERLRDFHASRVDQDPRHASRERELQTLHEELVAERDRSEQGDER